MDETGDNNEIQRLDIASRVLALDEKARTVKHIISTAALDRGNRIVDVGGWKLAKFKNNPVVLADHEYAIEKLIGKATDTRIEGAALVSTTTFAEEGLGNVAFRLVQAGLANAWSVGWMGLKSHPLGSIEDCPSCQLPEVQKLAKGKEYFSGTHYLSQDLIEYSLVAVPANPEAVMGLRTAGLVRIDEADAWLAAASKDESSESEQVEIQPVVRSAATFRALYNLTRDVKRAVHARRTTAQIERTHP